MSFRISALAAQPFVHLYGLDDEALARHNARRYVADAKPGFPCRVTLEDASPGERVLLVHHVHQPAETPFQASHAIYVREDALAPNDASDEAPDAAPEAAAATFVNQIPASLNGRTLSLRAFDAEGMMTDADLAEGPDVENLIERLLGREETAYVHAHYARRGCYAALIERA
jgi:Protein of unknown function (DUF1203)